MSYRSGALHGTDSLRVMSKPMYLECMTDATTEVVACMTRRHLLCVDRQQKHTAVIHTFPCIPNMPLQMLDLASASRDDISHFKAAAILREMLTWPAGAVQVLRLSCRGEGNCSNMKLSCASRTSSWMLPTMSTALLSVLCSLAVRRDTRTSKDRVPPGRQSAEDTP